MVQIDVQALHVELMKLDPSTHVRYHDPVLEMREADMVCRLTLTLAPSPGFRFVYLRLVTSLTGRVTIFDPSCAVLVRIEGVAVPLSSELLESILHELRRN